MARGQDLRREYSGTTKGCCTDTSGWDGGGRGSPLLSWPMYVSMVWELSCRGAVVGQGADSSTRRDLRFFFVGRQGEIARD